MPFPYYRQPDAMDCGPTCLRMVAKYYGRNISLEYLREHSYITREGVNLLGISEAAENIGFKTFSARLSFTALDEEATLPCILYWNQNHFVVLPPQNYNRRKDDKILIADPGHGLIKVDRTTFLQCWADHRNEGIALMLEPTDSFYQQNSKENKPTGFEFLFR